MSFFEELARPIATALPDLEMPSLFESPAPTSGIPPGPGGGSSEAIFDALGHLADAPAQAGLFDLFGGDEEEQQVPILEHGIGRAADKIALGQKLEVSDDPQGPNQVTQEEFDRIAKLYTDIRTGKTDIMFDFEGRDPDEAAELKGKTMEDIATMMQTKSGRAMIDRLANNVDEHGNHMSTQIRFLDDQTKAKSTRIQHGDLDMEWEAHGRDHNGVGNDAIIYYAPGQSFRQQGPDGYDVTQTGDSVLFHEMAHAYHRTQGTLADGRVPNPVHSLDSEIDASEYQATGLGPWEGDRLTENEYRRERALLGEEVPQRTRYSPRDLTHHH